MRALVFCFLNFWFNRHRIHYSSRSLGIERWFSASYASMRIWVWVSRTRITLDMAFHVHKHSRGKMGDGNRKTSKSFSPASQPGTCSGKQEPSLKQGERRGETPACSLISTGVLWYMCTYVYACAFFAPPPPPADLQWSMYHRANTMGNVLSQLLLRNLWCRYW